MTHAFRTAVLLLCLSGAAFAQDVDDASGITFPVLQVAAPEPAPPPTGTVPVLSPERMYVVESSEAFILLASPHGLAQVTYEEGPIRVRGVFADGNGKVETRTYTSQFLAFVDATKGANGRIELIGIPHGVTDEARIVRRLIDIGAGPQPPPDTPPGPGPQPPVLTGLAKQVYDSAVKTGDKATAGKLASDGFGAVLKDIRDGKYPGEIASEKLKIIKDTNAKNAAIRAGKPAWDQFFTVDLRGWLNYMESTGQLSSLGQIESVYAEITKGLDAASK